MVVQPTEKMLLPMWNIVSWLLCCCVECFSFDKRHENANAGLCADGASLCVELMGCFSGVEVQHASARVCAALASTGDDACMALIQADIGSMLQQHIKSSETTLRMFEDAALIISAIANNAGEV
jgi:hypothetical protein